MELANTAKQSYKYLSLLTSIYITALLASVIVIYKQVDLGPLVLPGSTLIYCITYSIADIVTEVYGYSAARKMIWISLICEFIFATSAVAIIHAPSPKNWHQQAAFNEVVGPLLHIFAASLTGTVLSSFINIYCLAKWKVMVRGKHFWLRSVGSSWVGELVLTFVVGSIVWYGHTTLGNFVNMALSTFLFKIIYTVVFTAPTVIIAYLLKNLEGVDAYDNKVNFNPFKF